MVLEELHVRDLALIEEVWLEFGPGMTVLTGETGAGKTALLGALKLLLGDRADSQSVRAGSAEALVEGRFSVNGDDLVVVRRVRSDGRGRCTLDAEMTTVGALATTVGPLVELHGQHEHQALLTPATHVGYLDRWAHDRVTPRLAEYREALDAWRAAKSARDRLREGIAQAARDADYLRFVLAEIDAVGPTPGEDAELERRVPALQHAERLAQSAGEAASLLRGDRGALDDISGAVAALGKVAGIDPAIDEFSGRLREAEALVDDVGIALRAYRDTVDDDPAALAAVHDRLARLNGLVKKYGPRLDDVIARRDEAAAALAAADAGDDALAQADVALAQADVAIVAAAESLAAERAAVAPGFVEALADAVSDLAMSGSAFEVSFTDVPRAEWHADGSQRIEFLYSPGPGQPARQLSRIASGGELSRVMLALKGVLGSADRVGTLVFDEIDAGIGGATALTVGARLAALAREHQVIVVTHLAQVAVFADDHLVVSKQASGESVATSVTRVEGEGRLAEVARMLAGTDSETGIAHARELVEQASRMADAPAA